MFIYEIEEIIGDEDYDPEYITEYLVHDRLFSSKEFNELCEEAKSQVNYKCAFEIKEYLILNYRFKNMIPSQSYEVK